MNAPNHILIIGSFKNPADKKYSVTAPEQLAALLEKNNFPVITATRQYKKIWKLADTVYTIIKKRKHFTIAILPLFGTPMNFIWQETAARLLKFFSKKIILVVHGGSIPAQIENGNKKFLKALQRADMVVCPSLYMQSFLSMHGIQSEVIENAIPLSNYKHFEKKNSRPHVLWMRTFEDIYNPEMAVKAAAILAKKYPAFKMVMAGTDKGKLSAIKQMISEYGLQEKIELPGYINDVQKVQYAEEFDIYINTNRIDNAPVSVVECMAMGLAVVSTNAGGIPYLVEDGVNGLLVDSDDAAAMAEKIISIIERPEAAAAMCSSAYSFAQQFDEGAVVEKWRQLLKHLQGVNQTD